MWALSPASPTWTGEPARVQRSRARIGAVRRRVLWQPKHAEHVITWLPVSVTCWNKRDSGETRHDTSLTMKPV